MWLDMVLGGWIESGYVVVGPCLEGYPSCWEFFGSIGERWRLLLAMTVANVRVGRGECVYIF